MIRQVELGNRSVIIDGRDVSNMCTGATLRLSVNAWPELWLNTVPDEVLFRGEAVAHNVPLDGIERLRAYVARSEQA